MIPIERVALDLADWATAGPECAKRKDRRYGHLTVRRTPNGSRQLEMLLLSPDDGSAEILSAPIPDGATEVPSLTAALPAAHWAERAIGDLWGVRAVGHPRWKSLILHDAWPADQFPYATPADGQPAERETHFMAVSGLGVHEIPVGPIHAGIIEPGHFRFSCLGEVIANLEIRLGYQHRGVEARLAEVPWRHARHVAESASSDSAAANALAHSESLEGLWGIEIPERAKALRTLSLEIERLANHLGDLGALSSDLGFALGAASFGRLRGGSLGLAQSLSGSRFQRGFLCPGGVAWVVGESQLRALRTDLVELKPRIAEALKLFFDNPGIQERLEGVGVLQPSLAAEFGMVGPTARASGGAYDARRSFEHGLYPGQRVEVATETQGDALCRAKLRRREIDGSLVVIEEVLESLGGGADQARVPDHLPPDKTAVGIVESWRGELIHWVTTDSKGTISRYAIRDPSAQNWTGLAIAARRNLVADFPAINKSFNLSYSGNDL